MNGKFVGLVVVIIVVIAGGWYLFETYGASYLNAPVAPDSGSGAPTTGTPATTPGTTVTYTSQGFNPGTVTVPSGTIVTFVNQTSNPMWVASDPYPTDEWYDGTMKNTHCAAGYSGAAPFDQCATGSTFTFTFTQSGSWGYHNDSNPADRGTIVVTASPAS